MRFCKRSAAKFLKDELLESARAGNEEKLLQLLTPLNINCQATDGRKSSPLHLAAGYNRVRIVQILLKQGPFTGMFLIRRQVKLEIQFFFY